MSIEQGAPPELERVRRLSYFLDSAIPIPGTDRRIGIDPIVGILPVQGDLVGMAFSLYIVLEAERADLPRDVIAGMLVHVVAEFLVGSIPVVGTIVDAGWKVNERNVRIMEEHLGAGERDAGTPVADG